MGNCNVGSNGQNPAEGEPVGLAVTSFGGEYYFTKDETATNCHRDYWLSCYYTLWSGCSVRRSWGKRGTRRPHNITYEFEDETIALKFLQKAVARRLRRGYLLAEYKPC